MASDRSGKKSGKTPAGDEPAKEPAGEPEKAAAGKGSGKQSGARKSGKRSGKQAAPAAPVAGGPVGPFPVICRECYEEFTLFPDREADVITCPTCGHGATRPNEDLLARIGLVKGQQESSARLAKIAFLIFIVGMGVFYAGLVRTAGSFEPVEADQTGPWMAIANPMVGLGVALVGLLLSMIFAAKHEGRRVEIYF